jgi:PAS domain S-box-containing protein
MGRLLHILVAEDNPHDAELLMRALRRAGYEPTWKRAETEAEFEAALHPGLDVVLSDYSMPNFSGLRALEITKARHPELPFILVSGTIGEDTAVEAMRLGATDYLLKHQLDRLDVAIGHALEQGRLRRERAQATQALSLFRTLVDQSSDGFEVVDVETGRYLDINETVCRELAYRREELLELTVAAVDPDATPFQWTEFARQLRSEGKITGEGTRRRKDGSCFPIEFNARLVRLDRDYVVSAVRNIAARRQGEADLRASEERFRRLIENASDMIVVVNESGLIRFISPSAPRVLGHAPEDLQGHFAVEFVHPDDHAKVRAAIAQAVAAPENPVAVEFRIRHRDGSWRVLQSMGKGMTGDAGEPQIVVNSRDVTESRALEQQFLHAQRMEAIGTLASGVAHDLNNILAPIMMVAGLLKLREGRTAKENDMLSMIERSSQRGADIIRQLLTFSRSVPGESGIVQPRHLIHEMAGIMRETFPRNVVIEETVSSDLWTVEADPTQLHQVLMNLCVNARDAMSAGGTLVIHAENVAAGRTGKPELDKSPKPHDWVAIKVQDTGTGIPPEIIGRIFEPFFTTKGVGGGTGLGLSTVMGIVRNHGGVVSVESEPGCGTTFRIHLPACMFRTGAETTLAGLPVAGGQQEWILVVDDEELIRESVRELLQQQGYRVLTADSGEAAVRIFIEHSDSVQLVVTDVMMPGMDGLALIRTLQTLRPSLRAVVASGLTQVLDRDAYAAAGVREILPKPFTPVQLFHAVTRTLAANGGPARK